MYDGVLWLFLHRLWWNCGKNGTFAVTFIKQKYLLSRKFYSKLQKIETKWRFCIRIMAYVVNKGVMLRFSEKIFTVRYFHREALSPQPHRPVEILHSPVHFAQHIQVLWTGQTVGLLLHRTQNRHPIHVIFHPTIRGERHSHTGHRDAPENRGQRQQHRRCSHFLYRFISRCISLRASKKKTMTMTMTMTMMMKIDAELKGDDVIPTQSPEGALIPSWRSPMTGV